jgi:hypothetical protein
VVVLKLIIIIILLLWFLLLKCICPEGSFLKRHVVDCPHSASFAFGTIGRRSIRVHVKGVEFSPTSTEPSFLVDPVATHESTHMLGFPRGRFTIGCGSPNNSSQSEIRIEEESDATIV